MAAKSANRPVHQRRPANGPPAQRRNTAHLLPARKKAENKNVGKMATKSAERLTVAVWLSFGKLFLHPLAVGIAALWVFRIEPFTAGVMIAAAALPVAGNVYILAQHYGVAPQRVSASILVSTIISVVTVSVVVGWVAGI